MTPTKFGLRLATIHTILVVCAYVWSLGAGYLLAFPAWFLLYALDLPAPFFLLLFDTFPVPLSYPWHKFTLFVLLFAAVGGAWWFLIGWVMGWCRGRLVARSISTRFVSALTMVLVVVVALCGVQFFFTIGNTAHDGCTSAGVPVPFFRGCYGTLSWYWPAMSVSKSALTVDAASWILVALLISLWRSHKFLLPEFSERFVRDKW